jgi:hypothetical protein
MEATSCYQIGRVAPTKCSKWYAHRTNLGLLAILYNCLLGRKIVLPYKKTSKKLKEMETEQGKIETMLVEMDSKLTDSIEDLSRLE